MVEVVDDEDVRWRGRVDPATRKFNTLVFETLLKLGDNQKIVIKEWMKWSKKDRWNAAQSMRDSLDWRLKKKGVDRKISVSCMETGEVWLAWRIDKKPQEDADGGG
jgi:hypothetical protein